MIASFADKATAAVYFGKRAKSISPVIYTRARTKLHVLNSTDNIEDLRIPPSNHLEKLTGDREGQYSIRINQQWRICFNWQDGHAENVEIVDYH
ncbi:type II toxin-antitoxin system RelE/ParE family toxin [Psychrobacter sp. I-STPA10]|uniref:type II toxin-antitoxin system RelE/ParE family toxin n=1 Tax=Psychrobacter sp. I-STPA10 TaxID=2585769 RepID=UPI001E566DFE|nr:type II toxin-antitoxin system RelE/ParE family toxin [Psychrobacter sp. I-STPA10]